MIAKLQRSFLRLSPLAFFLLSLYTDVNAVEMSSVITKADSDIVEMYSNEMPKYHLVFQNKAPEKFYYAWKTEFSDPPREEKWQNTSEAYGYIEKKIAERKFEEVDLNNWFGGDDFEIDDHLFIKLDEETPAIIFRVKKDSDLDMSCLNCRAQRSVFFADKWNYPRKVSGWGEKYKVNEMSWRYIDFLIQSKPQLFRSYSHYEPYEAEENLFMKIRENGLEKSIVRMVLAIGKEDNFDIFTLYNTEEEKENNINFILSEIETIFL